MTYKTHDIVAQIVLIAVVLLSLMKTFFFLRIVMSFSTIVTMIMQCISDLRAFLVFFSILIVMFSAILDIISKNESEEYHKIGPFMGNIMCALRLSLGDFDFSVLSGNNLTEAQHWMFWIIWVILVIFSSLIFLNFIIAEVSNSYAVISENIATLVYKERAGLIFEIERSISDKTKKNDKQRWPEFVVVRETDD